MSYFVIPDYNEPDYTSFVEEVAPYIRYEWYGDGAWKVAVRTHIARQLLVFKPAWVEVIL